MNLIAVERTLFLKYNYCSLTADRMDVFRSADNVVTCSISVGEIKLSADSVPVAKQQIIKQLKFLKWAAKVCKRATVFLLIGRIFILRSAGRSIQVEDFDSNESISFYTHLL
jgi:hypothetical protein